MISVVGFILVGTIVALLLFRAVSPIAAFATLPVIAALALGFSFDDLSTMASDGISGVAQTAFLFIFAILFFGLMRDRGLFDPLVRAALKRTADRPVRVTVATVFVAAVAHLDGLGAATFLLTIPAFLPIYKRMGMSPLNLVMLVGLAAGVINIVPWAGTTVRAAAAIGVDAIELWRPLIPIQLFGLAVVFGIAVVVGLREKAKIRRAATDSVPVPAGAAPVHGSTTDHEPAEIERPGALSVRSWRYWANVVLTLATITALITQLLPFHLCFAVALGIGLVLNYRRAADQDHSIATHAKDALAMGALIVTVGMFLGVMNGTGMLEQMGDVLVSAVPTQAGSVLHVIVGALGVPLGMIFGPDPYYFGILPLIQELVGSHGVGADSVARAMLIGENTGFAVSPVVPTVYLALGLANLELGRHIRHSFLWFWGLSLAMLAASVATGAVGF
ncbi:CitMHS family transporter [Prauserella cavernicola]|uniref:Citrate transporter n=1 Tax=Prauserella cavernicola TaxID=2800127 RepID=A0A934QY13_9PSEU|nr:citrate:proton symporter [Prauserella cavernicola]MBK1787358.1 citrate transporter [Prauserella cavernicola]